MYIVSYISHHISQKVIHHDITSVKISKCKQIHLFIAHLDTFVQGHPENLCQESNCAASLQRIEKQMTQLISCMTDLAANMKETLQRGEAGKTKAGKSWETELKCSQEWGINLPHGRTVSGRERRQRERG